MPESGAIPIPDDIAFDRACLIGCGVMTGVGAVLRVAKVAVGESAVVIGCGGVGLNAVQGAQACPRRTDHRRRCLAREAGRPPRLSVRPTPSMRANQDAAEAVRVQTRGRGADNVFEAAGNEAELSARLRGGAAGRRVSLSLARTNVGSGNSLPLGHA